MRHFRSFAKNYNKKVGLSPGSLVYVGKDRLEPVTLSVIDYNPHGFEEHNPIRVEACLPYKEKKSVTWVDISGIHDVSIIETIGRNYGFHPLTLEDVVNTEHRPKFEDFGTYMFMVLKMLRFNAEKQCIETEQVSLIMGENYVMTFQEEQMGDVFDGVRQRIRNGKGRIRTLKADYLAYVLMDAVVDYYFLILEQLSEKIEVLEENVLNDPTSKTVLKINQLKRELLYMRKSVWPLREEIGGLVKNESPLIHHTTQIFLRDLYDHTVQVIDTIETYRDLAASVHDMYLSSVSNRMNEIMKVLTIISTIFIPLTFIVGVYGMNFENMPELKWPWGYFMVWGIMLGIGMVMLGYFKLKKWF